MASKRVNVKAILADADLRRKLMVSTIQATQAREGIETSPAQADRAYYVVTEGEKATCFALREFKRLRSGRDGREIAFVEALQGVRAAVRMDVPRRDFRVIDGAPLAFDKVQILGPIFAENPPLSAQAQIHQGVITRDDPRFLRFHWEVAPRKDSRPWMPLHKGGEFCRFHYDTDLVIDWSPDAQDAMHRLRDTELYFREGLTWPLRTQRGLNVRKMESGCVFSHKGGGILLSDNDGLFFLLGLLNSSFVEYAGRCLASFGSWEVRVMRAIPVPSRAGAPAKTIERNAALIHDAKAQWDTGHETSTRFVRPWLVNAADGVRDATIGGCLDSICALETSEEERLLERYAELNAATYDLYRIPDATRAAIETNLGERPPEVIWPQMEGKTTDQKRIEHVWRLLSFAVKRVIDADDDGIVPFNRSTGETPLAERVRAELAALFPERDESQLEVEIVNELKRSVKGYRKCASLDDWLADAYFEYHAGLYKSRPIYWHVASAQGTSPFAFGALVHYHRFDKNRMAKLRASYVRDTIEELRRDAGLADKAGRTHDRVELQAKLEEVQALDKKLQLIQEGHHEGAEGGDRDFRILAPWKERAAQPKGWDPDLDDGVKVNIAPLDHAGVLRVSGVAG